MFPLPGRLFSKRTNSMVDEPTPAPATPPEAHDPHEEALLEEGAFIEEAEKPPHWDGPPNWLRRTVNKILARNWRWYEIATIALSLPAAIIGIPAGVVAIQDHYAGARREKIERAESAERKQALDNLQERSNLLRLALSIPSRPADHIDDSTPALPSNVRVTAQATAAAGIPCLLEIDGTGNVTLNTDDFFRTHYDSGFRPKPPTWTIIALAADPKEFPPDRLGKIQHDLQSQLGSPPALPLGRQVIWRDSGWTWATAGELSNRAPDPDDSAGQQLAARLKTTQDLLKSEFPDTPFIGRTLSVGQ